MKTQWLTGMILSCVVLSAYPNVGLSTNLLVNGGFETVVPVGECLPLDVGSWSGDVSEIVTASDGITPLEGSHMLKFIYPYCEPVGTHGWGQVWQLVDLSAYSAAISAGGATVTASGYFNRVQINSETDTRFVISLYAHDGEPTDYTRDVQPPVLTGKSTSFYSDSDISTWEFKTNELALPTDTDYVAVCVIAVEDKEDDLTGSAVEFHGHYCDGASLVFVPEPASASMLLLGAAAMLRRRKK